MLVTAFINLAYATILGRIPEAREICYHQAGVEQDQGYFAQIPAVFLGSEERRRMAMRKAPTSSSNKRNGRNRH